MSDALGRIAARAADVQHAYQGGFEPQTRDVTTSGGSNVESSLDPLSVAAPEGSYFIVSMSRGDVRYSRDGAFSFSGATLRTKSGGDVLGFAPHSTALAPLRLDPVERALESVAQLGIDRDGSVRYTHTTIDPRTGQPHAERVVVGRIALARFPAGTLPVSVDPTHVRAPQGVVPHVGAPADGNFAMLATGVRDIGRLDVLTGLARLQEAYLAFEALRAADSAHESTLKTTMNLLK